jgi:hypothetical protein
MIARTKRALGVAAVSLCILFGATYLLAADTKPAMTQTAASGKLSFARLYTTADGNSHLVDETIELTPLNGAGPEAHLTASRLGDVKGAMILDGEKRRVLPGQFVLLEDTSGKGHITHAVGTEDHVALAFPIADDVLAKKK